MTANSYAENRSQQTSAEIRLNLLLARRTLADQVGHAEAPYTPWALELLAQLGGEPEA